MFEIFAAYFKLHKIWWISFSWIDVKLFQLCSFSLFKGTNKMLLPFQSCKMRASLFSITDGCCQNDGRPLLDDYYKVGWRKSRFPWKITSENTVENIHKMNLSFPKNFFLRFLVIREELYWLQAKRWEEYAKRGSSGTYWDQFEFYTGILDGRCKRYYSTHDKIWFVVVCSHISALDFKVRLNAK